MFNRNLYLSVLIFAVLVVVPNQKSVGQSKSSEDTTAQKPLLEDIVKRTISTVDSIRNARKTFAIGLGIAFRQILDSEDNLYNQASISPLDSTLQLARRDRLDLVVSGIIVFYPFKNRDWDWVPRNLGLLAKLNLTEFSPERLSFSSKSIEGGLGLALSLAENLAAGLVLEKVQSRSVRNGINGGNRLRINNQVVTYVDVSDDKFFQNNTLTAISLTLVYLF